MEKKEEYGVPWLWKRVPVGTWVEFDIEVTDFHLKCVYYGSKLICLKIIKKHLEI